MIIQYRTIKNFKNLVLFGPGNLIVTQGDTVSLSIEAPGDILPNVTSTVRDDTLRLGYQGGQVAALKAYQSELVFKLQVKELVSVRVTGNGHVKIADVDADNFSCHVAGKRRVEIEHLTADGFELSLADQSFVSVAGDVESQAIKVSGQSEYKAEELMSDLVGIRQTDGAKAHIRVNDELTAYVSGGSALKYIGYPEVFKQGAGEIIRCREQRQEPKRESDHG